MARNAHRPTGQSTKRSSAEVRELLVNAAAKLFGERGYSGVSTRQIAEAAGVGEAVLWRQFGTKANLFSVAVSDPIAAFISRFVESFPAYIAKLKATRPLPPPERGAHAFYGGLYDELQAQKELLLALIAAEAFEPSIHEARQGGSSLLTELYRSLTDLTDQVFVAHGLRVNTSMIVRFSVGLVMSVAVFDELLFPEGTNQSRDDIVNEIVHLFFNGVAHQAVDGATS